MSVSLETLALAKKYVEEIVSSGGGVIIVDSNLSSTSTNPVQNKVIYFEIENLKRKVSNNQNYENIENKPSINGIILDGDKTLIELGINIEDSITNGNLLFNNKEIKVYSLPKATVDEIGGVKIGKGLTIDSEGLLSVNIDGISIVEWENINNKPTTVEGYGIKDLKIIGNAITIGNETLNVVSDENYVHTDNNYTNEDKENVLNCITTKDIVTLNG